MRRKTIYKTDRRNLGKYVTELHRKYNLKSKAMKKVLVFVKGGIVQWTASTDPEIEITVVDADGQDDPDNPYYVTKGQADVISDDLENCPEIDEEIRNELKKS